VEQDSTGINHLGETAMSVTLEGKRVLAVDDEPDILETLEDLLPMCQLVTASTYEEAKELLLSREFDIAILDIMGVGGYKLLDITREKGIPAVMLTAHALTPGSIVKSFKEGADSYIPKEEMSNIDKFLIDVLTARKEGKNPWKQWEDELPGSYFEKRFGAAWKDKDRQFWETFRASVDEKKTKSKKQK
jgi:CheY-like chemotaxis protein